MKTALFAVLLAFTVLRSSAGAQFSATVSVTVSVTGMFAQGYSWRLTIAEDGAATLNVARPGTPDRKSFQIPPGKLKELRELLLRERFFELGASYGASVPDGSTTTIAVQDGTQTKTVELRFLRHEDPRLAELRRAVRVSIFIRGLFEHPDAVDLRRYDRMMLDDSRK